jgi:AcrR family transcriptional regulator
MAGRRTAAVEVGRAEDERRDKILACAARLFRHYGQTKTTMVDIAREASIGVGSVYLVFPSKESIVEELSAAAHVRVLRAMREVAAARASRGFAERLSGVLEARVTAFQTLAAEGQHACELMYCKAGPVQSVHARFRQDEHALLVEIFEDAKRTAELSSLDAKRTAALVQRAYASLSPPWLFDLPEGEAKRTALEMCRLLLLGLIARERDERSHKNPSRRR